MYAIIERFKEDNKLQTRGVLSFYKKNDDFIESFFTLELPDLSNKCCVSCIKKSVYMVEPYSSFKYPSALKILDVENRSNILIHFGNYKHDIEGCILVGTNFRDINNDGLLDLINSKKALKKIMKIVNNQTFKMAII